MTFAELGRATEARFIMDASQRGLYPARPFSDLPGYDVIVDTPTKKLLRVQVRGARPSRTFSKRGSRGYRVNLTRKGRASASNWDVLAVHLEDENQWVFFLWNTIKRKPGTLLSLSRTGKNIAKAKGWEIFH